MATNELQKRMLAKVRQWRITAKSDDGISIRYEEPFSGNAVEAKTRAGIIWARTSYVVNARQNRDVYASLEVLDEITGKYRMIKEKRGRYPRNAPPPAKS